MKSKGTEGVADRTDEKRAIGERWAATASGIFVMPFDRDYDAVNRALQQL